ncbi:MAG: class I SAM-dependent methyltransferase, partial [Candidatus Bipolaricaulaceae bacterium]
GAIPGATAFEGMLAVAMSPRVRGIVKHYEKRAALFGTHVKTYGDAELARLCWRVLPPREYTCVLDLAAGQGDFFALLFPDQRPKAVFFDISAAMLKAGVAKGRFAPYQAVVADAERGLPFLDETFDLVLCRYAWHDFRRQAKVAREVSRVLAQAGVFLFVDMSLPDQSHRHILRVYNTLHTLKTGTETNIITFDKLVRLLARHDLHCLQAQWYHSKVRLTDWEKEGQIDQGQRRRIFRFVMNNERARFFVDGVDQENQDVLFSFPVLVASFEKSL